MCFTHFAVLLRQKSIVHVSNTAEDQRAQWTEMTSVSLVAGPRSATRGQADNCTWEKTAQTKENKTNKYKIIYILIDI